MSITRDPTRFEVPSGSDLRELRLIAGLSLTAAAEQAGVSTDTLRRWERGEFEPRISDCETLLDIYTDAIDGQQQLSQTAD